VGDRRLPALAALLTAGAVVLTGCGTSQGPRPAAAPAFTHTEITPTTTVAGAQAGPSEAVTAPKRRLKLGAKGEAVTWLQKRLRELGYRPGKADGRYGGSTLAAVWAFQKVNGVTPTSTVASRTWSALESPKAPKVLVRNGKPTRVEVNLSKQVAVLYVDGQPKLITHISSGSGVPYCETATWQGKSQRFCGSARTPTGDYRTTWRATGWHKSYLGQLYNPIFFNGGIALHGALSVPLYPASHGCVRMPMNVAAEMPGLLGKGVPVHVRGAFRRG
jgi:lipoprotein-anchoring transpeptidase ErfK/SrfK